MRRGTSVARIAGRAGGAVAIAVTLTGLAALPGVTRAAAATSQSTAASRANATSRDTATARSAKPPAVVTITGMNPRWAGPRSVVAISGSLTNTLKRPVTGLVVQVYASAIPVSSVAEITPGAVPIYDVAQMRQLAGAHWRSGRLRPGQSIRWRIHFRARRIGMTMFGVYPLAAVAYNRAGVVLSAGGSYLPFMPGKRSAYIRPKPERIAWLWPLIDKPLLGAPWQASFCRTPQARALARSLSPGGRLATLVAAGQNGAAAAAAATAGQAAELVEQPAGSKAARGAPRPSLAGLDGITWAVDPALLANAKALTQCRSGAPRLARAARAWLASVGTATADQPLFTMPYGDPNVVALMRQNHLYDVTDAFRFGRDVAAVILHRDIAPSASQSADASAQTAAIAWPTGGAAGYATIENLAGVQIRVRTVVLSRSALPHAPSTAVRIQNGGGSYSTLLLANDRLGALLGSAGHAPGSAFATAQAFLAQTALLAAQQPGQPIVVAPPARWNPSPSLTTRVLAETASAPWLSPVGLTTLASGRSLPDAVLPPANPGEPSYPRKELGALKVIRQQINQMEGLRADPQPALYLAIAAVESSAWDGKSRGIARAMLHTVALQVAREQGAVAIVAGKAGIRITLGGLKGSVPVSIDNPLDFPVRVRVRLFYNQATGVKIVADPAVVTIPARSPRTIKLHVQATEVGSTTLTMRLANSGGQLLASSRPARMTVQATQVGVLGMIIFACALGVVLIASAARAVRHGRPVPGGPDVPRDGAGPDGMDGDQAGNGITGGEHTPGDAFEGHEMAGKPTTVVPERSELGAPGPPGL